MVGDTKFPTFSLAADSGFGYKSNVLTVQLVVYLKPSEKAVKGQK